MFDVPAPLPLLTTCCPSLRLPFLTHASRQKIQGTSGILSSELLTTAAIHTNVIAGQTSTLSPFAPTIVGRHEQAEGVGAIPNTDSGRGIHGVAVRDLPERSAFARRRSWCGRAVRRAGRTIVSRAARKPKQISITAYEIDAAQIEPLQARLDGCRRECESVGISFSVAVLNQDFIAAAVPMVRDDLFKRRNRRASTPPSSIRPIAKSAVIPPRGCCCGRRASRRAICMRGLWRSSPVYWTRGGELVAITPRSFCNGPYFKPFREDFLETMSLRRLHVFESRSAAFSGDAVLQENIIFHAVKGAPKPKRVVISTSSGEHGGAVMERADGFPQYCFAGRRGAIHSFADGRSARASQPGDGAAFDFVVGAGRVHLDGGGCLFPSVQWPHASQRDGSAKLQKQMLQVG